MPSRFGKDGLDSPAEGGEAGPADGGPSIRRSVALTTTTNLSLALVNAIGGIVAARLLGPSGRGGLAAIQTIPSFIGTMAVLGLPEAVVYFSARYRAKTPSYLGTAICLALATSIAGGLIAYPLMPWILHSQPDRVITGARVFLIIGPIYATGGLFYQPLRAYGRFLAWNLLRLAPALSWTLILTFASLTHRRDLLWLIEAQLVATGSIGVVAGLITRQTLRQPIRPTRDAVRPLLRFGLPAVASTIPQSLNLRFDQMLLSAVVNPRVLGLYAASVAWGSVVTPGLTAIGTVLFPAVASEPSRYAQRVLVARMSRASVIVAVSTSLAGMAVTPFVVPALFGSRFEDAVPAAMILVLANGVVGWASILEESIRGLGSPGVVLRAELGALLVTAGSLGALLGPLGIEGAAISSLLGYSTLAGLLMRYLRRDESLSWLALAVPRRGDVHDVWSALARRRPTRRSRQA